MLVRAAGIEPARLTAADFKSDASTNFAMPASARIVLRPANVVLANEHGGKLRARQAAREQRALHINKVRKTPDLRCGSGRGAPEQRCGFALAIPPSMKWLDAVGMLIARAAARKIHVVGNRLLRIMAAMQR